jgi:chorismate mutase-like protein
MSASAPRELCDLRDRIDAVDDRILALLAERCRIAGDVAACKRRHGIPARLPDRIQAVMERCTRAGTAQGLDAAYVRGLWAAIIEETCRLEEQLLNEP